MRPSAELLIVLATRPSTKLFGDGFDVGLLVPVARRNVFPEDPETLMLYVPDSLSVGRVPAFWLVEFK